MQSIAIMREFETKNFRVVVDAIEDNYADLSFDDTGEVMRDLEKGNLICFAARARVFHKSTGAELASDYLGGCIYESVEAFMDHKECGKQNKQYAASGETARCGSYFKDMIATVCAEARKHANSLRNITLRTV